MLTQSDALSRRTFRSLCKPVPVWVRGTRLGFLDGRRMGVAGSESRSGGSGTAMGASFQWLGRSLPAVSSSEKPSGWKPTGAEPVIRI